MAKYRIPGSYINEISTFPPSIQEIETAIPAFIGHTATAEKNNKSVRGVPTFISSLSEYESIFGLAYSEVIVVTIEDTYTGENNQPARQIGRTVTADPPTSTSPFKMYYSLRLFFENGGGPCYIISVNDFTMAPTIGDSSTANSLLGGLAALEKVAGPTLILFPDDMTLAQGKSVYGAALAQCKKLKDRFVIVDVKETTGDPRADALNFRDKGIGSDDLCYGAAYYPNIKTKLPLGFDSSSVIIHQSHTYLGLGSPNPAIENLAHGSSLPTLLSTDPDLHQNILSEITKLSITLPPSGAVAGIYARVDRQRGVWKAPANVEISTIDCPAVNVSNEQQKFFNVDANFGKSINVIRLFTGKGSLVWGARTLAGNDNEWRYIPVRRFFIFVENSIKKATEFVVFEPNDANTWLRVKTMIDNFLTKLWRNGALSGSKPEEAFFVKVGLGLTMTVQDILAGKMIIEIGLASIRPAEFNILRLTYTLLKT